MNRGSIWNHGDPGGRARGAHFIRSHLLAIFVRDGAQRSWLILHLPHKAVLGLELQKRTDVIPTGISNVSAKRFFLPSDFPFKNNSTSSAFEYAMTGIVMPALQFQEGSKCTIGFEVQRLWYK